MGRTRFDQMNCGIAQALEILGDWWTLLIVRDAFFGIKRFSDFQADLGIAKNILSDRLQRLVDHEILERREVGATGSRREYHLTEKGEALLPVLTTLREWSDEWVYGAGNEPVLIKNRATGKPIPKLRLRDASGRTLGRRDLRTEAGPGATARTRAMFRKRA
jgi:DNA-binding HxlR family transcriptional regulator